MRVTLSEKRMSYFHLIPIVSLSLIGWEGNACFDFWIREIGLLFLIPAQD